MKILLPSKSQLLLQERKASIKIHCQNTEVKLPDCFTAKVSVNHSPFGNTMLGLV